MKQKAHSILLMCLSTSFSRSGWSLAFICPAIHQVSRNGPRFSEPPFARRCQTKKKPCSVRFSTVASPEHTHPQTATDTVDTPSANTLSQFEPPAEILTDAPPLTFSKCLTPQNESVVVTVRYSGEAGLHPYFLTVARKLKADHPDLIVERCILPKLATPTEATFEVLVDGKVVVRAGKGRSLSRVAGVSQMSCQRDGSVFVSMQELRLAIARARRRRCSTTNNGGKAKPSSFAWRD